MPVRSGKVTERILKYKGYIGSVSLEIDTMRLYGKILHIPDLIIYQAKDLKSLEWNFRKAVKYYVEYKDGEK